jgi:pyridoxal phosphate enzyme (YggS family)
MGVKPMERNERNTIANNLEQVRERIARAAELAGRQPIAVKLVAVTKYVGPEVVSAVIEAGGTDLGESRPQQLWAKRAVVKSAPITWHLIGPLQTNKVERTIPLISLLHSLDSERLASAVATANVGRTPVPALLEVNISGDATKHGVMPDEAERLLCALAECRGVMVAGLMTMAGRQGGKSVAQGEFARLRELRDRLRRNCPPGMDLEELSMGMSGDFEEAIAEGATIVRIGSLLFEELPAELMLNGW